MKVFNDFSPKYYVDVKKDEMGEVCCTHGGEGKYKVLLGKREGKRPL